MAKKGQDGEQRVAAQDNQDAAQATVQGGDEGGVEVRLNPRLVERAGLKQVEIAGDYFYAHSDTPQYATEEQAKEKDPDSGLQYLVKKGG